MQCASDTPSLLPCSHCLNLYLDGEQHGQKLPLVSDQHGVANQRHGLLHRILYGDGRDVLASGCDDQLCERKEEQT